MSLRTGKPFLELFNFMSSYRNDKYRSCDSEVDNRKSEGRHDSSSYKGLNKIYSSSSHKYGCSNSDNVDERYSRKSHERVRSRSRERGRDRSRSRDIERSSRERHKSNDRATSSKDRTSHSNERHSSVRFSETTKFPSKKEGVTLHEKRLERLRKEEESKVEKELDKVLTSIDIDVEELMMTEEEKEAEAQRKREERRARLQALKSNVVSNNNLNPCTDVINRVVEQNEKNNNIESNVKVMDDHNIKKNNSLNDTSTYLFQNNRIESESSHVLKDDVNININSDKEEGEVDETEGDRGHESMDSTNNDIGDDKNDFIPMDTLVQEEIKVEVTNELSAPKPPPLDLAALRAEMEKAKKLVTGISLNTHTNPIPSSIFIAPKDDENLSLHSNWDDEEGYYKVTPGEVLGGSFKIVKQSGQGVFGNVIIAEDILGQFGSKHNLVALKLIRNNEMMKSSAKKEVKICNILNSNDIDDRKCCVRLLNTFTFRNHFCLVFEAMAMDLRATIMRDGHSTGLNVDAVRLFGRQLFLALSHLAAMNIIHCDVKPDNILLNANGNIVKGIKLCDFGSASEMTEPDALKPTTQLVSRYYRAPEIMLGLEYGPPLDVWAAGVCLFEMIDGNILFNGGDNNEMLKLMQDTLGKFPNKMIRAHIRSFSKLFQETGDVQFQDSHFEEERLRFKFIDIDPVTKSPFIRLKTYTDFPEGGRDMLSMLKRKKDKKRVSGEMSHEDIRLVSDLLKKCLNLDPSKRLTAKEAFKHPFFNKPVKS